MNYSNKSYSCFSLLLLFFFSLLPPARYIQQQSAYLGNKHQKSLLFHCALLFLPHGEWVLEWVSCSSYKECCGLQSPIKAYIHMLSGVAPNSRASSNSGPSRHLGWRLSFFHGLGRSKRSWGAHKLPCLLALEWKRGACWWCLFCIWWRRSHQQLSVWFDTGDTPTT